MLAFRTLHPNFAAEVSPVDLRCVHDQPTLDQIRAGMDAHGVLVFRDQPFTDDEHLAFAQRLDGRLHTRTGSARSARIVWATKRWPISRTSAWTASCSAART